MKVAFVAPPISGHLNPMTTLARELQSRNHDVVIISLPDGEPSVRAAGLTFLPCAAKEFPAGSLKERFRQRSKLKGEKALRAILQSAVIRTEAMLNSLPATHRDNAHYFQKVIAETNGLSKAANLLERAFGFGNGRPLLAK